MKKQAILFLFLLIASSGICQDNPYAVFGYKAKVEYKENRQDKLRITNTDPSDPVRFLEFDFNSKVVNLFDRKDSLVNQLIIADNKLLRWISTDPLAEKYPGLSPYNFVYNNPLNNIDPDGREGIVVSGQPGDHNNREHFLVNGLDRAREMAKQFNKAGNGEQATWMVYNGGGKGGYSAEKIEKYQKLAEKYGINMQVVSDADKITDYVNDKTGGSSRADDQISKFAYVGHATPGDLDVGFVDHNYINMMTNDRIEPSGFSASAFKSGAMVDVVAACRTSITGNLPFEQSVIKQFAGILDTKSTIKGADVRVYFPGGVVSDKQLVKPNNGNIITINGTRP